MFIKGATRLKQEFLNKFLFNKKELKESLKELIESLIYNRNAYINPPSDEIILVFNHYCNKRKKEDVLKTIIEVCDIRHKRNSIYRKSLAIAILYFASFSMNKNLDFVEILNCCNLKQEDFNQKELLEILLKSCDLIEEVLRNAFREKD